MTKFLSIPHFNCMKFFFIQNRKMKARFLYWVLLQQGRMRRARQHPQRYQMKRRPLRHLEEAFTHRHLRPLVSFVGPDEQQIVTKECFISDGTAETRDSKRNAAKQHSMIPACPDCPGVITTRQSLSQ